MGLLKELLMRLRRPLVDERVQVAREQWTEKARQRAIHARQHAEEHEQKITAAADRIGQMRSSFSRASQRLADK